MAKKTPHNPKSTGADAAAKDGGRIRQMFSRKKNTSDAPDTPNAQRGMSGLAGTAGASLQGKTMKAGALTHAAVGADKAVGRAHGAISRVNSFVYYGSFVAGGLAMLGSLPLVGKMFKGAAEMAGKPRDYMDKTTVRDALHTPTQVLGKARSAAEARALKGADREGRVSESGELSVDGLKGSQAVAARLANGLGKANETVGTAETGVVSTLKTAAEKVFNPLGDLTEKVGVGPREKLAGKLTGKAGKHHGDAISALEGAMSAGVDNEALSPVRETLEKAKDLLGDGSSRMSPDDATAFQETLGAAREGLSDLAKGSVDKKTLSGLQKGLKQVEDAGGAFNQRSAMADKVRDLPDAIRDAPQSLANANLTNVALKGAVVTGTTLQVTSTARGIAEKVHALKQMHCDLTGDEKISTRKLLTSKKVPGLVKEARGQIMKEFGPRVVLNFANTIATYGFMKNNSKQTMLISGGLMGLTQLHTAKVQSYELLPMYEALNQQPQIQDVQYAAFISAASKDAAKAGGIESALVQALAVDYAKEGTRPTDILKEIENGRFDERAMDKAKENRAAMEKLGGHKLAQSDEMARGVVGAHTQRLQEQMARRQPENPAQMR